VLVFLVPLKSRRVARSWTRTCRVFERTLRSICQQSSSHFRVLVVCHEIPEIGFSHPNVEYLPVTFPPPPDERSARLMDRRRKELAGQIAARRDGRCHVFKVDGDDCVSQRTAAFVEERSDANGWAIERGYVYLESGARVRPLSSGFHRWCGTGTIVRSDLLPIVPSSVVEIPEDPDAYAAVDRQYYLPHMDVADVLASRGTPLEPLPFPGAIYVVGHGDNSGEFDADHVFLSPRPLVRAVRRVVSLRPLTETIRDEFGLYDLDGERRRTT
jgi:hypothetical protein